MPETSRLAVKNESAHGMKTAVMHTPESEQCLTGAALLGIVPPPVADYRALVNEMKTYDGPTIGPATSDARYLEPLETHVEGFETVVQDAFNRTSTVLGESVEFLFDQLDLFKDDEETIEDEAGPEAIASEVMLSMSDQSLKGIEKYGDLFATLKQFTREYELIKSAQIPRAVKELRILTLLDRTAEDIKPFMKEKLVRDIFKKIGRDFEKTPGKGLPRSIRNSISKGPSGGLQTAAKIGGDLLTLISFRSAVRKIHKAWKTKRRGEVAFREGFGILGGMLPVGWATAACGAASAPFGESTLFPCIILLGAASTTSTSSISRKIGKFVGKKIDGLGTR